MIIIADNFVRNGKPINLTDAYNDSFSVVRFGLNGCSKILSSTVCVYPHGKRSFTIPSKDYRTFTEINLEPVQQKLRCTSGHIIVTYQALTSSNGKLCYRRRFEYHA